MRNYETSIGGRAKANEGLSEAFMEGYRCTRRWPDGAALPEYQVVKERIHDSVS